MSLGIINEAFQNLTNSNEWTLQLIKINVSKKNGIAYIGYRASISPEGTLKSFVDEISNKYCSTGEHALSFYESVDEYDGTAISNKIYKLSASNKLIENSYEKLISAIANPTVESDLLKLNLNASIFIGKTTVNSKEYPIKLISMQKPVTTLRHKFYQDNGVFKEISDKVISLRSTIDVMILEDTVYMLTMSGETLFNMEHAYKAISTTKIKTVVDSNIMSNSETFSAIASKGHNPRKFISFNESHLEKLKDPNTRVEIANTFNLPLNGTTFDTVDCKNAEKLVKLLCDKGKIDPFDKLPVEVAASKKWE